MSKTKYRSGMDRERVTFDTGRESPVKQAMKAECDINTIMARYRETGIVTHGRLDTGRYEDVSELGDYQECLEVVRRGQEVFAELPAEVRARFDNDPAKFVDFATDPDNVSEMVSLGLLPGKAPPELAKQSEGTVPSQSAPTGDSDDD